MSFNLSVYGCFPFGRCSSWFGWKGGELFGSGLLFLRDEVTEAVLQENIFF